MAKKKSWYEENGRYFNIDSTEVVSKVCSKCGEEKSLGEFKKNNRSKYGATGVCKVCIAEYNKEYLKEYYDDNKESILGRQKEHYEKNKEAIIERQKEYYEKNKEVIAEYKKEYAINNKEVITERWKEYREKNKEAIAEYHKEYYGENKEVIAEYKKEYTKTPQGKEVYRRARQKRRALKQQNGGSYTSIQWEECKQFFNNECAYSGQPITLDNSHVEHIVPISKGGANYIWNLCTSLDSVNISKSNKDMETWYRKQEYFTEERLSRICEWQDYAYDKYSVEYDSELEAV